MTTPPKKPDNIDARAWALGYTDSPTPSAPTTPTGPTLDSIGAGLDKAKEEALRIQDSIKNMQTSAPIDTPAVNPSGNYTPAENNANQYINNSLNQPKTEEQIQADMQRQAQAEIDNLNKYYDSLVGEQRIVNEGRSRSTASINTLTGLAGSDSANVKTTAMDTVNQKALEKVNNERAVAIGSVLSKIRSDAVTQARQQRLDANADAQTILEQRKQRIAEATTSITTLAQSGVTFDGLKTSDPDSFKYLSDQLGGEQILKGTMILNRPKNDVLESKIENGWFLQVYKNPVTGAVTSEVLDLGLPKTYDGGFIEDMGGHKVVAPKGWTGDTSELISLNKTPTPSSTTKGSITSGALTVKSEELGDISKTLEDSRGSDGHVDSGVYLQLWESWKGNGGLIEDFLKTFPPKLYTNPTDKSLPAIFRVVDKATEATGSDRTT